MLMLLAVTWSDHSGAQVPTTITPVGGVAGPGIALFIDVGGVPLDVTNAYMPKVDEIVYLVVIGGSGVPELVAPSTAVIPATEPPPSTAPTAAQLNPYVAQITTSAYLGVASNYPSAPSNAPAPTRDPDFVPSGATLTTPLGVGHGFRAMDYGGMLVVQINGAGPKYVVPKDNNTNGIPDSWELTYGGNLASDGDIDSGPGGNNTMGDGISNLDEYRGFIVSGQHVRTDPRVKNVFVHLVNPQCGTNSYLGGGSVTYVPFEQLFNNLDTLVPGTRVSVLGAGSINTTEWVDHFVSYSEATRAITYLSGTNGAISDRRVNANAVYPLRDLGTGRYLQKGLRMTECLDPTMQADLAQTILGSAGLGTANGPDNALIYTQRIINWVNAKLGATVPRLSRYANGSWTSAATTTKEEIYKAMMQYIVAMEIGHSVALTPTIEGTRKTSYGYHHAPGTGSNMDVQANYSSGTFSIPSLFSTTNQASFKVRN
jgi:hypothetical protein